MLDLTSFKIVLYIQLYPAKHACVKGHQNHFEIYINITLTLFYRIANSFRILWKILDLIRVKICARSLQFMAQKCHLRPDYKVEYKTAVYKVPRMNE